MTRRLRILHVIVTPVLVYDDGDELTPGPQAQPIAVPLSGVAALIESLPGDVAKIDQNADDSN
jgi:hypothetical protein